MKIKIENTDYEVKFNYDYMKFYMAKYKLKTFIAFEKHSSKRFSFPENIGIDEFEVIAKFIYESFTWHLKSKPALTLEEFNNFLFENLQLVQEVIQHYQQCQPRQSKSQPMPITEGN